MPSTDRALRALAALFSVAILLVPAMWNRFPLLQWDTGGYLARWYEGTLVISRAAPYGLMLTVTSALAFWPLLIVQAALTVWIFALILRTHGFGQNLGDRPLLLVGIVTTLSIFTTLPWLTSILLTDIFCGLGVLALYMLLLRSELLSRCERIALIALIAVAASTHNATMAVLMALVAAAALIHCIDRARLPRAAVLQGIAALALGAVMVLGGNYIVAKRVAWTPGGFALSFGHMLQDGIINKYLDAHCPQAHLKLCTVKDQLPRDADVWFWGSKVFDGLGRFAGLDKEMEVVALGALREYPGLQAEAAVAATWHQLIDVRTGEGVLGWLFHTPGIIKRYTPDIAPAMNAARQQTTGISFAAINELHYPLALIAMALLPVFVLLAWRRKIPADLGELATVCILALAANAFVCGALSNPHDRYGARMVWLAAFATGLAIVRLYERYVAALPQPEARDILPA